MTSSGKKSILNGAISMAAATLIVKIIGVIYKVPLTYILGDEGMGYFNSAYTVYGFFYVISSAGIPKAITMLIARSSDNDGEVIGICRSLFKMFAVVGTALTAVFIILARPLSLLIGSSGAYPSILVIGPSIFLVTLSGVLRGYVNGRSDLAPIALSQLIEAFCKLLLGLALALLGKKLLLPLPIISALAILGITLGSFFSLIYIYVSCFGKKERIRKSVISSQQRREIFKSIVTQAIPLTLSSAIGSLSGVLDLGIVINALRAQGYSEIAANSVYGNYSTLAVPMIGLVSAMLLPVSMTILPKLSTLTPKSKEFAETFGNGCLITIALSAPVSLMFFLYPFDILDILFKSSQSAIAAPALASLSLSATLLPLLTVVNTALEASGKMSCALISLSAGVVLKTAISVVLIPRPEIGVIGAAIGTVASYSFSLFLSMMFLGGNSKAILRFKSIAVLILVSICYIPTYLFIYAIGFFKSSTLSMMISAIFSTVAYAAFLIMVIFPEEIKLLKDHYAQKNEALNEINP